MNFKERLNLNTRNNNSFEYNENEVRSELSSFDVFCRNSEVEKILRNTFIRDKNVIIASKKNSDKDIIYSYIKKFIGKAQSIEVIEHIDDDVSFNNATKIIVPEPSIDEIVKILEFILCDYKSFIFSLNIKSYENIIESLKTLILLNFPNLINSNVQHLIGSTKAIIIYVSINEKGNYFVTNIGEIEYNDGKISLNNLYDKKKNEKALFEDYGAFADIEEETIPLLKQKDEEKTISANSVSIKEDGLIEETTETDTKSVESNEENIEVLQENNTEKVLISKSSIDINEEEIKENEIVKESEHNTSKMEDNNNVLEQEISAENKEVIEKDSKEDIKKENNIEPEVKEEQKNINDEALDDNKTKEDEKANKYKQLREKLRKRKTLEK